MEVDNSESHPDCILYELLVYSEWIQEPESLKYPKPGRKQSLAGLLQYFRRKNPLHDDFNKLLFGQLPWLFAVGGSGEVVSILQDTLLEIRSTKDEYSSIIGKATVPKDMFPQYRKMVWSFDCSLLAVSHSSGSVALFDLMGSNVANIPSAHVQLETAPLDTDHALCNILFLEPRVKNPDWSFELVLVDFKGNLRCYLVSASDGFEEYHSFRFSANYRGCSEVTAVAHHPSHNLLFVAGPTTVPHLEELTSSASGLYTWRLLNDYPHYRFALGIDEKKEVLKAQRSLWNWLPTIRPKKNQSIIFKMEISPNGSLLACLHSCGGISLWNLPALRIARFWALMDQPDYNVRNPQLPERRRYSADDEFHPIDVNWWSDEAVIIARNSGAVSVCAVTSLRNLLGESPEFLAGHPEISSQCTERGFLGLECEVMMPSKRAQLEDVTSLSDFEGSIDLVDDETDEEEDAVNSSLLEKSVHTMQSAVYMLTDIERFQPQRRKLKLVHKTYRLLGLKSTTPEDLYARKIDCEEYGEALALAQAYNLDCDLVYQRQWRNCEVSIATIHDYLSKITKRSWVLRECVERIPKTFSAIQELLQFGLRGTNLETLIAIGEGTDGGHFVSSSANYEDENEFLGFDEEDEQIRRAERNQDLLAKLISPELSADQKTLLCFRQQLLQYQDRLSTYEIILGGRHSAEDNFDAAFYAHYRSTSALSSVVEFARDGNWEAVRIMFTYHSGDVLPHWLPVLENFPESMNPLDYRSLLPECNGDGAVFVWERVALRDDDWCERDEFQRVFAQPELECGDASMQQFACKPDELTADMLTAWYSQRSRQIENRSCMVDHALTLVKLARERNVTGLDELLFQLLTLETLVYDVYLEHVRLEALEQLSALSVCPLLMCRTTEATFVSDLKHLLVPFLVRCETKTPGSFKALFRSYLLEVSIGDLGLPLVMFEHLRDQRSSSLGVTQEEAVRLALESLYTCQQADQLDKAFAILECIPLRSANMGVQSVEMARLYDQVDQLECELRAAAILDRYNIRKPLCYIRDKRNDARAVGGILVKLARSVAKRMPPPNEIEWNQLLNDMMDLQGKAFTCFSLEKCFELYVGTLLASGSKANIRSTAEILQCRDETPTAAKSVSYQRSVELVLEAAAEYFDSAGSLTDPAMELAKACLHLISDKNDMIEERLDLIAALQLLNDFGITMLPLQVRLCSERMRLVESCVRNKPLAYRSAQRLLQLAHKLRVAGNDARLREAKVLVLVAEAALEVNDYSFCSEKCQKLVSQRHALGWRVVQHLGQREDFTELRVRVQLLAYALLYCAPDDISPLVATRSALQARLVHEEIGRAMALARLQARPSEDEFSDALTSPEVTEKEFAPMSNLASIVGDSTDTIRQSTYSLLKKVGNRHFWKDTFGWATSVATTCLVDEEEPLSRPSLPELYAGLHKDFRRSCLDTRYDLYSMPDAGGPSLHVCRLLVRVALLEATADHGTSLDNSDVLLKLSEYTMPEDNCLGLSQLLALSDRSRGAECFRNLPCTEIALQLAMYFSALDHQLSHAWADEDVTRSPIQLIERALQASPSDRSVQMYIKYRDALDDLLQAKQLNSLGCGIDLRRFTNDVEYRHDTIIGLAMTTDKDRFELSLKLGIRYDVPSSLVAASHVATLLLNGDLEPVASQVIELLKTEPQVASDRLMSYVYPSLCGTDLETLLLFYSTLKEVDDSRVIFSLTTSEHIMLLKQLQAAAIRLDYKLLTEEPSNAVSVIEPVLTSDNVALIGQLLARLPAALNCTVQLSSLLRVCARNQFFSLTDTTASLFVDTDKCLREYSKIYKKYFNEMATTDIVGFVKDICFAYKSLDMMAIDCRMKIIGLSRNFCDRKSRPQQSETQTLKWKEASITLEQWLEHLTRVSSFETGDTVGDDMRRLLHILDVSRGESGPIRQFLLSTCLSAIPLASVKSLLALVPAPQPSLEQVLEDLLSSTVAESQSSLSAVIRRMQQSVDEDRLEFTASSEAISTLCGDLSLAPDVRLQALQLLQSIKLGDMLEDSMLYHRTQAMVAATWPSVAVLMTDVESDEARSTLFRTLVEETDSWLQIKALFSLLDKWPSATVVEYTKDPWCQLLGKVLQFDGADPNNVAMLFTSILQKTVISEDCLREVIKGTEFLADQTSALLLCLLSDYEHLHLVAAGMLCKHQQVVPVSILVVSLLVKRGLTPHVISSPYYPHLVEHLLQEGGASEVAAQLAAAGYTPEAGTLRLLASGAPPTLRVFSAAVTEASSKRHVQ